MTDSQFILLAIVAAVVGLVILYCLLVGIYLAWPVALVLVVASYLVYGAIGVGVGLLVAGLFGLAMILVSNFG
ncbi:MAG: hypothetical protein WCD12_07025 [Candidatus Binatus sp.]|uniref:hypothetical protein n=1 Tax=Candidatus Binatus sp. TaxID=2811406 RepID=UPI003C78A4ED